MLLAVLPSASGAAASARPAGARAPLAPIGSNLIRNGSAELGDASGTGYDAVTIPGWQVVSGLPSVINYGTPGFFGKGDRRPSSSGHHLFIGGAGGPATLAQRVQVRLPGAGPAAADYSVSAALGGQGSNRAAASLRVIFEGAGDVALGTATLAAVTAKDRSDTTELVVRRARGPAAGANHEHRHRPATEHAVEKLQRPGRQHGRFQLCLCRRPRAQPVRPGLQAAGTQAGRRQDPPLRPRLPRLSGERGLSPDRRQQAASPLHQQPPAHVQRAGGHVRRGAPERRQLPGLRRRERVRGATRRSGRGELPVHDRRQEHR